ncbi:MAG: hypothetical protein KDA17_01985 [Candidatus Saccharibacteria bacterium]|nr:hypothetical protein [Candidatus Saccharibacteria bacterium]
MTILVISFIVISLILANRSKQDTIDALQDESYRVWQYNSELQRRLRRIAKQRMIVSDLVILTKDDRPVEQITVYRN